MRRVLAVLACLALLTALLPASSLAAVPSNDNFANATLLIGTSGSISGTNAEATLETDEAVLNYREGNDLSVWFVWSPGRKDVIATFSTCGGAAWDTVLQAFTGLTAPPVWGSGTRTLVAYDDDGCPTGYQSSMAFMAKAGVTYWIQLTGYDSLDYGTFTLAWTAAPIVRGSLSVTLTNTTGDATLCTMVVKSANLAADQGVWVWADSGANTVFYPLTGRWTSDPQYLPRSEWNVEAAGSLALYSDIYTADGFSVVTPKFTNRCKAP